MNTSFSVKKLFKSFGYALNGLRSVIKSEQNFKVHIAAAAAALLLSWALGSSPIEFAIIVVSIVMVLGAEIINTSIEKLCDLVAPQYNEKIKLVKDLAAAAVLIVAIGALIAGSVILLPKLFAG